MAAIFQGGGGGGGGGVKSIIFLDTSTMTQLAGAYMCHQT